MTEGNIRRGMRGSASRRKVREAAGSESLEKVIENAENERPGQIARNIGKFFEHKADEKKPWETEGKGLGPQGEQLTLEDLIFLKPFKMEDLNSTIAFRANEKMMRAFQRVKENSGGVYDILSDLYRDCAILGLLVLSERHKSILGMEVVISQAEKHQRHKEEAVNTVLRLRDALKPLSPEMRKVHFHNFMNAMDDRPKWLQEIYLEEIRSDKMLSDLLEGLREAD